MQNQIRALTIVFMMFTGGVNLNSAKENLGSQVDGEMASLLGESG